MHGWIWCNWKTQIDIRLFLGGAIVVQPSAQICGLLLWLKQKLSPKKLS